MGTAEERGPEAGAAAAAKGVSWFAGCGELYKSKNLINIVFL